VWENIPLSIFKLVLKAFFWISDHDDA